jgi:hypothetical protein
MNVRIGRHAGEAGENRIDEQRVALVIVFQKEGSGAGGAQRLGRERSRELNRVGLCDPGQGYLHHCGGDFHDPTSWF